MIYIGIGPGAEPACPNDCEAKPNPDDGWDEITLDDAVPCCPSCGSRDVTPFPMYFGLTHRRCVDCGKVF